MSSPADRNVVDIDLGSAEFKANAHMQMAAWARRPPFYVLGCGQPQVVVGRCAASLVGGMSLLAALLAAENDRPMQVFQTKKPRRSGAGAGGAQ